MLGFLSRFVDSNERELKRIQPFVDEANALEPELEALSDAEIRARFEDIRAEIQDQLQLEERGVQRATRLALPRKRGLQICGGGGARFDQEGGEIERHGWVLGPGVRGVKERGWSTSR